MCFRVQRKLSGSCFCTLEAWFNPWYLMVFPALSPRINRYGPNRIKIQKMKINGEKRDLHFGVARMEV